MLCFSGWLKIGISQSKPYIFFLLVKLQNEKIPVESTWTISLSCRQKVLFQFCPIWLSFLGFHRSTAKWKWHCAVTVENVVLKMLEKNTFSISAMKVHNLFLGFWTKPIFWRIYWQKCCLSIHKPSDKPFPRADLTTSPFKELSDGSVGYIRKCSFWNHVMDYLLHILKFSLLPSYCSNIKQSFVLAPGKRVELLSCCDLVVC